MKVVKRFISLQGDDLNGGLVFREFLDLDPLTWHSTSAMPLSLVFRVFFLDSQPVHYGPYWEEGEYGDKKLDVRPFLDIAGKIGSRFFTMDIAKTRSGRWIIIELGDGQVSDIPSGSDKRQFYRALYTHLG